MHKPFVHQQPKTLSPLLHCAAHRHRCAAGCSPAGTAPARQGRRSSRQTQSAAAAGATPSPRMCAMPAALWVLTAGASQAAVCSGWGSWGMNWQAAAARRQWRQRANGGKWGGCRAAPRGLQKDLKSHIVTAWCCPASIFARGSERHLRGSPVAALQPSRRLLELSRRYIRLSDCSGCRSGTGGSRPQSSGPYEPRGGKWGAKQRALAAMSHHSQLPAPGAHMNAAAPTGRLMPSCSPNLLRVPAVAEEAGTGQCDHEGVEFARNMWVAIGRMDGWKNREGWHERWLPYNSASERSPSLRAGVAAAPGPCSVLPRGGST